MKLLILVRHAKSSWADSTLMDIDRPLNKRGNRNAPEMGARLKKRGVLPDLIVSSPAIRAYTTADYICDEIGYPQNRIIISHDLYHSSSQGILEVVRTLNSKNSSVMLFGHNPGFTSFVNSLCGVDIWNIPTAGIAECNLEVPDWSEVTFGTGQLSYYDFPKNLTGNSAI